MEISLTHFLNINFLILTLFPYARMFLDKSQDEAKSYAISFCTNGAFVICYSMLCIPTLTSDFVLNVNYRNLLLIVPGILLSLGLEIFIVFIKYRKIRIVKFSAENKFYIFFFIVIIPIFEEIIYISCLYGFCIELSIPKVIFVILSSIAFGLSHFRYPKINILTKTVWGVIFALIYLVSNSLYLVIIVHILNNLILYIASKKINSRSR